MSGRIEQMQAAQNGATYVKPDITTCYVVFALEDGDAVELRTSLENFCSFVPGDRGVLTYKGGRLISFTLIEEENQSELPTDVEE
ncbi:MAG: DUF2500 family protein, partial [Firmicutes bacterium]|nr:DUF2500 family protein [Bacillota bacterium]